ncbi:MAG: phage portal protein [Anaerolineae bacterium]|nr:phage portal protein [Anaerolineae bacterium]
MNLFSPILRLFGLGKISNNDKGFQTGTSGGIDTDTGITVSDERALKVSAVWACLQYITNSVCSLPLGFYRKSATGRVDLERHALTDLFQISPNQWMKPRDFRKAMTLQMAMWQNAYAEIIWNGSRPIALMPLRPGRMTPFITDDGELTYHYQIEAGVKVYAKKSILHLKGFGTDGIVGLERMDYARQALGLSVSADTYASKQFAHGGRSGGGYLMFDQFLTEKQREQARSLYEGLSATAVNKGKLWVLEGGVKYESDTLNPDTMQMIETRKMNLGEIARFFGVPEVMIGAGSNGASAWPASFEQQLLSFLTFTLQDYIDEWEMGLSYALLTPAERRTIIIDHDVTGFIKMDSEAKAKLQATWVQNGLKTRNEIRKINNDPAIDGGDDLTVQVNLTPVQELEKINAAKNQQSTGKLPTQVSQ